ncbi:hypothetical protein BH11ACT4_BH11ACT4_09780 [soil metagenome]
MRAVIALVLGLSAAAAGAAPVGAADSPGQVKLALAVPLVVPQGAEGLLTAEQLAQYTSPLGVLSRQLDAVINRPVAIGIDPMIIVSIRALGAAAPPSATSWLQRLSGAGNQTFALAFDDSDLTLATQAGAAVVPTPQSFDFALDQANFAPQTTATPAPAPNPNPTLPAFPTTRTLLDWPYTLSGIAWPREDSVVSTDLKALAASGYSNTILSSGNVGNGQASSSVDIGGERAVVADAAVSQALRAAARAVTDSDWAAQMSALSAAIAAAGRAQGGSDPVVLGTFDRDVPFTGGRLAQTLSQLDGSGDVRSVPLSTVIAGPAAAATITDMAQDGTRVALITRALETERAEQQFASVAADPLAITASRRLTLLGLLANQWQSDLPGWTLAADGFLTSSADLTSSVEVVKSSGINLLADRATLPIGVTNKLDQPVTVYISVRADTGLLAVESSRVKLVIEPRSQAKGQVPVQAISNGSVGLTISLTSASGVPVGSPTRATINVQAGWETPIVIVIGLLVVAMFAIGVVRSILRRRREAARHD